MAAFSTTLAFFPAASKVSWIASSTQHGTQPISLHNHASLPGGIKVNANARHTPKLNGTQVTYSLPSGVENADKTSTPPARTLIDQLPDWSVLLTAVFLVAEKQLSLLNWKPRRPDVHALADPFFGEITHNDLIFQQSFPVRSYEIGADGTSSIQWFMNNLQETALNHARIVGLLGDGYSSKAMSRSNLIWAVTKMHIVVNRYPSWGDVVEVDTWIYPRGKNGMGRDWHFRNKSSGEILAQASSSWVMMNTTTRRLSKIPGDVRVEIEPNFSDCVPILEEDGRKLPKLDESTADNVQNGLTPRWFDLDVNQHVNNIKYIGWILESCISKLKNHELVGLTLEYRKECHMGNVLQSMTAVAKDCIDKSRLECVHLLRLDNGTEIARGRTTWRPKHINIHRSVNQVSADNM